MRRLLHGPNHMCSASMAGRNTFSSAALQHAQIPIDQQKSKLLVPHGSASLCCMQSPERLQARLEELAGGVDKERGLVADAERRSRDLQARMDIIAKVLSFCSMKTCHIPNLMGSIKSFAGCCPYSHSTTMISVTLLYTPDDLPSLCCTCLPK